MLARLSLIVVLAACGLGLSAGSAVAIAPPTPELTWVARVVQQTQAHAEPDLTSRGVGTVRAIAPWNRGPMQLMVDDVATGSDGREWVRLLLARKPNGSYGWVPTEFLKLSTTRYRIRVDLSERRISVLRDGRVVKRSRVVIGAKRTPTPTGMFAVREIVRQPNQRGFSGPYILHLNANSEKLKSFDGGDGTIGIHGRGPSSFGDPLGSARSHGCVRIPNGLIRFLARHADGGTPVEVVS